MTTQVVVGLTTNKKATVETISNSIRVDHAHSNSPMVRDLKSGRSYNLKYYRFKVTKNGKAHKVLKVCIEALGGRQKATPKTTDKKSKSKTSKKQQEINPEDIGYPTFVKTGVLMCKGNKDTFLVALREILQQAQE